MEGRHVMDMRFRQHFKKRFIQGIRNAGVPAIGRTGIE
jgi:hypothetical protein